MSRKVYGVATLCLSGVGGSGVVAAEVAAGLAARGHRVHLISDRLPFRAKYIDHPQLTVHEALVPESPALSCSPISLALASKLVEVVKTYKLDRIHVHYAVPNAVVAQLARMSLGTNAPPTVVTLHGTDVHPVGSDQAYRTVTRTALLDASILTAPSKYLATQALDAFGLEGLRQVRVIPNFVDASRFPSKPSCLSCAERPFTIIHVSNFRPVKRAGDALEAFAKASREVDARLVMVGDGPERRAVQERAEELQLGAKVRFVGVQHDVVPWLADSDVALVPSGSESFGLSALEALAAGVPVVASRVGGLTTVVGEGRTGLMAEVGDISGFAEKLVHLAKNSLFRRQLGDAGRRDAETRFRPGSALDEYEAALEAADEVAVAHGA